DDVPWPPAWLPNHVLDAGNIDERHHRNALLELLAQQPPARLLIVCDAQQTPDRGTLALVAELAQRAAATGFATTSGAAGAHREAQWRERIQASKAAVHILDDLEAEGVAWLNEPEC